MAKSTGVLIRQNMFSRPSRRHIVTSSPRQSSTSPQRMKPVAASAQRVSLKSFSEIPGPIALPMLRHSAHVLPRIGNFHHTIGLGLLEGLREKYGDLVRLAKASRSRPVLYVFDPEMMREVYQSGLTDPPKWERSPLERQRKNSGPHCPFLGDESRAVWVAIKTLLQDTVLLQQFDRIFDDIAADFTRRLRDLRHAENALNEELETEVYRWSLEIIGAVIFGIRLGCLDGVVHTPSSENRTPNKTSLDDQDPELCSLSKRCFEELSPAEQLVKCSRELADHNYLVRSEGTLRTNSEVFNNALKTLDKHYSLSEHFLAKAMVNLKTNERRPEQAFLSNLKPLGDRILPLASDFLLAGVEPLAHSVLSMFYHFSLNPAKQQRLRDELTWAAESREAGLENPELQYIAACAKETLRIHPVTGGVVRRSREELIIKDYEIPAGVDIVLAHGVTSKLEKQWSRANAFIPERWCHDSWEPLKASKAHPFSSMPFGESCPGNGIVEKVMQSLAIRVLEQFRIEWHGSNPSIFTSGVNKIQKPFYFVLQNAE